MYKIIISILFVLFSHPTFAEINKSHAISMHGEPKYKKNFENLDYVNPNRESVFLVGIPSSDQPLFS